MSRRACPKCGNPSMDRKSKRCAACKGYGRKRHLTPSGYVRVYKPGHPMANGDGYALEHRWMLYEMAIPVPAGHHTHHINGNKADNRWSNLEVLPAADHVRNHVREVGYIVNQYGEWPVRNL